MRKYKMIAGPWWNLICCKDDERDVQDGRARGFSRRERFRIKGFGVLVSLL